MATARQYLDVAPGSWYATSRYTSLNTVISDIGATVCVLIVDSVIPYTGNLTIPDNIRLWFWDGGDFTGTGTLTVNAKVWDDRHKDNSHKPVVFAADSISSNFTIGQWINMQRGRVLNPFEFGAKGDGSTDDSAAMTIMNEASRDSYAKNCDVSGGIFLFSNVRIYSGTKWLGGGRFNPFTVPATFPYLKMGGISGQTPMLWCEASGSDPEAAGGIVRDIGFFNVTMLGPNLSGQYASTNDLGFWAKGDSNKIQFINSEVSLFSRQSVLQEQSTSTAGNWRIIDCGMFSALATENTISDYVGTIHLNMGENFIDRCSIFAGSNQDYATYPADLWRTALWCTLNEQTISNSWFQFGDVGVLMAAQYTRMENCRIDNCKGHALLFKKQGTATQPRQCQIQNLRILLNGNTSQHANNAFDGIHITNSESINGILGNNIWIESNGFGSTNMRYGLYNGGASVGTTDPIQISNSFQNFRSKGHATAAQFNVSNTQPGARWNVHGSVETFIDDATPNCEGLEMIRVQSTTSTTITEFENKFNGDDLYVMKIGGGTVIIQDNANNVLGSDLTLTTNQMYHFRKRLGAFYRVQ